MKRFLVTALIAVIVITGLPTVFSNTAHAASLNHAQTSLTIAHQEPSWIVKADPYIHISHYVATIDPSIRGHLTAQEMQLVVTSVEKYNSLSVQEKQSPLTLRVSSPKISNSCRMVVTENVQWWGTQFYFNDCAIQTMVTYEGYVATLAGLIAGLCPPCAPISLVLATVFLLDAGTLSHLDSQCGGRGAYLNETWVGVWWDSSVC